MGLHRWPMLNPHDEAPASWVAMDPCGVYRTGSLAREAAHRPCGHPLPRARCARRDAYTSISTSLRLGCTDR